MESDSAHMSCRGEPLRHLLRFFKTPLQVGLWARIAARIAEAFSVAAATGSTVYDCNLGSLLLLADGRVELPEQWKRSAAFTAPESAVAVESDGDSTPRPAQTAFALGVLLHKLACGESEHPLSSKGGPVYNADSVARERATGIERVKVATMYATYPDNACELVGGLCQPDVARRAELGKSLTALGEICRKILDDKDAMPTATATDGDHLAFIVDASGQCTREVHFPENTVDLTKISAKNGHGAARYGMFFNGRVHSDAITVDPATSPVILWVTPLLCPVKLERYAVVRRTNARVVASVGEACTNFLAHAACWLRAKSGMSRKPEEPTELLCQCLDWFLERSISANDSTHVLSMIDLILEGDAFLSPGVFVRLLRLLIAIRREEPLAAVDHRRCARLAEVSPAAADHSDSAAVAELSLQHLVATPPTVPALPAASLELVASALQRHTAVAAVQLQGLLLLSYQLWTQSDAKSAVASQCLATAQRAILNHRNDSAVVRAAEAVIGSMAPFKIDAQDGLFDSRPKDELLAAMSVLRAGTVKNATTAAAELLRDVVQCGFDSVNKSFGIDTLRPLTLKAILVCLCGDNLMEVIGARYSIEEVTGNFVHVLKGALESRNQYDCGWCVRCLRRLAAQGRFIPALLSTHDKQLVRLLSEALKVFCEDSDTVQHTCTLIGALCGCLDGAIAACATDALYTMLRIAASPTLFSSAVLAACAAIGRVADWGWPWAHSAIALSGTGEVLAAGATELGIPAQAQRLCDAAARAKGLSLSVIATAWSTIPQECVLPVLTLATRLFKSTPYDAIDSQTCGTLGGAVCTLLRAQRPQTALPSYATATALDVLRYVLRSDHAAAELVRSNQVFGALESVYDFAERHSESCDAPSVRAIYANWCMCVAAAAASDRAAWPLMHIMRVQLLVDWFGRECIIDKLWSIVATSSRSGAAFSLRVVFYALWALSNCVAAGNETITALVRRGCDACATWPNAVADVCNWEAHSIRLYEQLYTILK